MFASYLDSFVYKIHLVHKNVAKKGEITLLKKHFDLQTFLIVNSAA